MLAPSYLLSVAGGHKFVSTSCCLLYAIAFTVFSCLPVWPAHTRGSRREVLLVENFRQPLIDGADFGVDSRETSPTTAFPPADHAQQLVVGASPFLACYSQQPHLINQNLKF